MNAAAHTCDVSCSRTVLKFVCIYSSVSNATRDHGLILEKLCHQNITNITDVTVGAVGVLGAVIAPIALGLTFVNAKRVDIGASIAHTHTHTHTLRFLFHTISHVR